MQTPVTPFVYADFTQETAARLVDEVLPRVPGASGC